MAKNYTNSQRRFSSGTGPDFFGNPWNTHFIPPFSTYPPLFINGNVVRPDSYSGSTRNSRPSQTSAPSGSRTRVSSTTTKPSRVHHEEADQTERKDFTPESKGEQAVRYEIEKRGSKRKNSTDVQNAYDAQQYQAKRSRNEENSQIARSLKFSPLDGRKISHSTKRMNQLSDEIMENFKKTQQTQDSLMSKMKLRAALLSVFQREFPACNLHLVGSSTSGLAADHSDADFCLLLNPYAKFQRYEVRTILRRLQGRIQRDCPFIKRSEVINATVPILKLWDSVSGCECDININNTVGIRNTHLLRAYAAVDQRVRPLVIVIKKWAKVNGINDASKGTLSSYSLVMLVLHFLQEGTKPPVLPSLQQLYPSIFNEHSDVNNLTFQDPSTIIPKNWSSNKQSMGELLLEFFKYYAEFRWEKFVINVKQGRKYPRVDCDSRWMRKYICIEEPFDGNCVAKSVFDYSKFCLIQDTFRVAYNTLKISPMLESILKTGSNTPTF